MVLEATLVGSISWETITISIFTFTAGINGIHAGWKKTQKRAQEYSESLMLLLVATLILYLIQIIISEVWKCPDMAQKQCRETKNIVLISCLSTMAFFTLINVSLSGRTSDFLGGMHLL